MTELETNHGMKAAVALNNIASAIQKIPVTHKTTNHRAVLRDCNWLHSLLIAAEQCRQILHAEASYYQAVEAREKMLNDDQP